MDKSIKICLLWHNLNSPNYGVGALAISHLNAIVKVAKDNNINLEIETIGTSSYNGLDVKSEMENRLGVVIKHKDFGLRKIVKDLMLLKWNRLNVIKGSGYSIVFDIGEGDSFCDIYGIKRFIIFSLSKWYVLKEGIPLVLSPQTIGPFRFNLSEKVASYILRKSTAVFVRDHKSSKCLEALGVGYTEVTDLAFSLQYDSTEKIEKSIGLNVSALLWHGGYTKKNQFNLCVKYQQFIVDVIKGFVARGMVVYLISHVIADDVEVEDDYRVSNVIKNQYFNRDDNIVVAPKFQSPIEAKSFISKMGFFLGSRMHATIGALSSGVPTIPLAYSRKFSGVFGTIQYPYTIDLYGESDSADIISKIFDCFDNRLEEMNAEGKKSVKIAKSRLVEYESYLSEILK